MLALFKMLCRGDYAKYYERCGIWKAVRTKRRRFTFVSKLTNQKVKVALTGGAQTNNGYMMLHKGIKLSRPVGYHRAVTNKVAMVAKMTGARRENSNGA